MPKSNCSLAMYEGKNIHYSLVDQKPLCSFSGKICNQRRLNKYGFCVRHILEDPYAPFKRCAYVAKSSRQTCTQPIPKTEEREYCNNHMQVLGMLPKKERKTKKEKDRVFPSAPIPQARHVTEANLQHSQIKRRLTVGGFKTKLVSNKNLLSAEDMDDVYAFPTDSNEKNSRSSSVSTITSIPVQDMSLSNSSNVQFCSYSSKSSNDASGGHSSLAKIYPELAEKLEKIKPRVETKVKGKVKSSRTMNSLQTKIAQNKIKDKLKRNQGSSNASSQSQSPSHSFSNASSPGYHIGTSSPNVAASPSVQTKSFVNVPTTSQESHTAVTGVSLKETINSKGSSQIMDSKPSLSQLNLLNSINIHSLNLSLAQLGLPVPAVSDIEQTFKQLLKSANISLDGASLLPDGLTEAPPTSAYQGPGSRLPAPQDLTGHLLRPPYVPKTAPPPPYSSVHHKPTEPSLQVPNTSLSQLQALPDSRTKPENLLLPPSVVNARLGQHTAQQSVGRSEPSSVQTLQTTESLVSVTTPPAPSLSAHVKSSPSSVLSSVSSSLSPVMSTSTTNAVTAGSDLQRTTPVQQSQQKSKVQRSKPRSRNPSVATKRPVPVFTLPMTLVKPRKMRKLSDKKDTKILKCKSAIKYCERYDNSRRLNHNLIISGFDSSDESDVSDCDMLSWQPDWFRASSDEEAGEEDESDYDLRTTKLALTRARLRRQCFQGRGAYRDNTVLCRNNLSSTSDLISVIRDSQTTAVTCLNQIMDRPQHKVDKYKMRGLEKRKCLFKNNDDVQCTNIIVPYANHCIKHVMYNVDQQLFEYCTAKFADNTQCCHPVSDVKHELPLCIEHGVKADNFLKTQDAEPKPKKPRKKTKPSALTRPPKKGKKKKNQRKTAYPQKPIPSEEPSGQTVSENDEEHNSGSTQDEADDDNDTDKESGSPAKSAALTKMALLRSQALPRLPIPAVPVAAPVVKSEPRLKQLSRGGMAVGQLEELDNLSALSDLDNVKMFGDLPLETASKLLEENDFQEVLNRLPVEAFDLFSNKGSSLPSNEEIEELEKSLHMASSDFKFSKDTFDHYGVEGSPAPHSMSQQQTTNSVLQQQQSSPILDEADELTRQIAEEILNQNIGSDISMSMSSSMCNGDAQESIKAIARSLSNSGMMLTSEANQRAHRHEYVVNPGLSRTQNLQAFGNLGKVQNPPNVMVQNIQQPHSQSFVVPLTCVSNKISISQGHISQGQMTQGQMTFSAQSQVPRNVTITPQGIFQSQLPVVTSMFASVAPNVAHSSTAYSGHQSTAGIVSFPGAQQFTSQQLQQLVQQGTLQLPPLPPYTPPTQQSVATSVQQAVKAATKSAQKALTQEQITLQQQQIQQQQQELARQQEQLTQQQQLLTQQLLTQQLAVLTRQGQIAAGQAGKLGLPTLPQGVNLSALLQPGQMAQIGKLNHQLTQSLPSIIQSPHIGKSVIQNRNVVSTTGSTSVNLPTTNIIWTAPPNMTLTTPNGIPRTLAQSTVASAKQGQSPVSKASLNDAYIDLTETGDPPPYTATQQTPGQARAAPLTSLGSQTLSTTVVTGKS